jgi:hypothetical protein
MVWTATPTGINFGSDASPRQVNAAEAIVPGRAITNNGNYVDATDENKLDIAGISVTYGSSGKRVFVVESGDLTVSDDLSAHIGKAVIAETQGRFQYDDEISAGDTHIRIGYVKSQYVIQIDPKNTGIEVPTP